jgi:hypothetical protein
VGGVLKYCVMDGMGPTCLGRALIAQVLWQAVMGVAIEKQKLSVQGSLGRGD